MKHPLEIDTSRLKEHPNYRPVFFDFEVLRQETMLTIYDVYTDRWTTVRTPAECGTLLMAYMLDPRTVFAGFNNKNYDNMIAAACIHGWSQSDIYMLNEGIIRGVLFEPIHGECYADFADLRFRMPGVWDFAKRAWDVGFDLPPAPKMSANGTKIPYMSLKKWEKFNGIAVHKSPISFDHPLPLTDEEATALAEYNKYDVAATAKMGCNLAGEWATRCGFVDMLGGKKFGWHKTFTKLAADLFVAHPDKKWDPEDTSWIQTVAQLPACLKIEKNLRLLDYFSMPLFEIENRSLSLVINGHVHTFKIGGAHSVNTRGVYKGDIWHIDVGGMYPSIMSLFNLCSRTMDPKKYNEARLKRMAMSKSDWRRDVYKKALNSTYGGTLDPFSTLYDPMKGRQVCVLAQLFIVDVLERVEPYTQLIQTNTDGVYVIPNSPEDAVKARAAVESFERRTGLVMEIDHYVAMYQRDVNNYIAVRADGTEKVKGGAFRSINHLKPTVTQMMNRCEIMGIPFDPDQFPIEDLAIVCTRDKNTRGFSIDGVETGAETIDVVPVFPFQAQVIHTVKKNGDFCKARLCPEFAALAGGAPRSEIDFGFYRQKTPEE